MVSSKKESIDLIEAFIDTIWMEKGLSSNTLSSYKQDLLSFSSWLPNKDLVEADKSTILDYLSYRLKKGYSSRSTSRCLSSIRAFYKYLLFNSFISKDPTEKIESPKLVILFQRFYPKRMYWNSLKLLTLEILLEFVIEQC